MAKTNNSTVAVIGGGSWATALVKILSNNSQNISWWVRKKETADYIRKQRHNPDYISDVEVDTKKVTVTSDIKEAVSASDILILAVPSAFLKDALKPLSKDALKNKIIVSAIKGIVPDELLIIGEYLNKKWNVSFQSIAVITGPC